MLGSYFSSQGSQIVQAAAGLGAGPRYGFVQAAAGLGAARRRRLPPRPWLRRGHAGIGDDVAPQPVARASDQGTMPVPASIQSGAETPSVVGGATEFDCMMQFYQAEMDPKYAGLSPEERTRRIWDDYSACRMAALANNADVVTDDGGMIPYGSAVVPYRDGIFAIGPAMEQYGREMHAYRDGIFSMPLGAVGAGAVVRLDLGDPQVMREFKMALRSLMQSLPVEELDNPAWDETTEMQWRSFVVGSAAMPNADQATIATWNQKVDGKDFPTGAGASAMLNAAVMAQGENGPQYAATYWPALTAWQNAVAAGGSPAVKAPQAGLFGLSMADTLAVGAGAALALGLAWLAFGRKRR